MTAWYARPDAACPHRNRLGTSPSPCSLAGRCRRRFLFWWAHRRRCRGRVSSYLLDDLLYIIFDKKDFY